VPVRLDIHSEAFRNADFSLGRLIGSLRTSLEIRGNTRDQLMAELKAGQEYLRAPKLNREILKRLLLRPLIQVADRSSAAEVGGSAQTLFEWLTKVLAKSE
jgi:hypothetical protein